MDQDKKSGYGGRPLWQSILIYLVVGIVVYGLIYYFVLAKKGSSYTTPYSNNPTPAPTVTATSPAATQTQNFITLTANGFSPSTLTITAGQKVTWTNNSGADATVNSNPHPTHTDYSPLNLGSFPNGGILSLTFAKPGTYGYHNHLNPSQKGTIIVQ